MDNANKMEQFEEIRKSLIKYFPLLISNGFCPTMKMIRDVGINIWQVNKCLGGMKVLCTHLGLQPSGGFLTRDKHCVRSYYELILDEYLYSRGIPHTPEVIILDGLRYRCDQKVGDYYVEIWGFTNCHDYDKRRILKESLYKENGMKLIGLTIDLFKRPIKIVEDYLDEIFYKIGYNVVPKLIFSANAIAEQVKFPWNEAIIKEKIQSYIDECGVFPTQNLLKEDGLQHLQGRITQFGGFCYFRKIMGCAPYKKVAKWTESSILNKLKNISFCLGKFPRDTELSGDIRNAIRRSKRDLNYYKNKLGNKITKVSTGYWTESAIEKELISIIDANGNIFPTNRTLIASGKYNLSIAIQKHPLNFNGWREKLGFPIVQGSPYQYTDENIVDWLSDLIEKTGSIPKQKDLVQINGKLQAALNHRGGIREFIPLLKEKYPKVCENFLERNGGKSK